MTNVYIGYDPRDHLAYQICEKSINKHSTGDFNLICLKEWEVRKQGLYWRSYRVETGPGGGMQLIDDRDGRPASTQFSFTRFLVPALENYESDWAMFVDADFMFRHDLKELLDLCKAQAEEYPERALFCVKHKYFPEESVKMDGVKQEIYRRKNWSSLYICRPKLCRRMTKYNVNNMTGSQLHAFTGFMDEEIGDIPEEWNWLEGWSSPDLEPKAVHYTRGTPDMLPEQNLPYAKEWWGYNG